jgi:O-antigen/teichoic acid export membrane protein
VLWSAVFITVSTLYRPIDQLLSRHISERRQLGQPIRQPMRVAATIQLGLGVAFAVLALVLRGPLQHDLLSGNETLYWVYFSAVLGYAASYFARGFLAGNRRFALFSLLILSESIFRTIFALVVAIGLFHGQSVVALGIVAAPCLSLIVVPLAFARRAQTQAQAEVAAVDPESGEGAAPEFSLAHGTGFAASVLLIMFSEQTFLNAGPLLIRATDGAAAAGFIFNVLMVARAPLQLFQAIGTSILPHLTGLHHSDEEGSDAAFQSSVRFVLMAVAAFAAAVALAVLALGPQLMHLAFGKKFDYDRLGLLIVTAGMGLYLSAVTVNQACLAQGQVRRASLRWIACAAFFIAWCLLPVIGNEFRRVEIGFTVTAASLLAMLYVIYRRPIERPEDVPDPGSTEELEGLVAAADEAG